jgi:hypothetical protein
MNAKRENEHGWAGRNPQMMQMTADKKQENKSALICEICG